MNILTNRQTNKKIGNIQLDATLSENQHFENTVTSYPVQGRQNIGINVRMLPETITISGVITNSPLHRENESLVNDDNTNRALVGYNELMKYGGFSYQKVSGESSISTGEPLLIDIIANMRVFTSMIIETFDSNQGSPNELRFTLKCVKYDIKNTEFIEVQRVKDRGRAKKVKQRIQNKRKMGKENPKDQRRQSTAITALKFVKGLFK